MSKQTRVIVSVVVGFVLLLGFAVVAVIGVGVGVGFVGYGTNQVLEDSKVDTSRLILGDVAMRVQLHALNNGSCPSQAEGLAVVYEDEPVPVDAWGHAIVYVTPGPGGAAFDLISYGSDGAEGGSDLAADLRYTDL